MNILVTGGGGFLGSAVCRQLAERGHDVSALQRRPATHLESFGVRSIEADIDDADAVARAAEGCGAIVHTAGKAGIWGDPADFRRVNVDGTANVLRACGAHGIPFLVHTSSPSVVHAGGDIEGGDESLPLATRFSAPYPETKAEAERLALAAADPNIRDPRQPLQPAADLGGQVLVGDAPQEGVADGGQHHPGVGDAVVTQGLEVADVAVAVC